MEDITTVAAETYPLQLLGFTEIKEAVGAADAFSGLICRQYLFFPLLRICGPLFRPTAFFC